MRKRLVGSELNDSKKNVVVGLHCVFQNDVLCSFRKSERSGVMNRCFKCEEYVRFMREMDDEEDEFWVEVDAERKKIGSTCHFDSKACQVDPLGACFSVEDDGLPNHILRSVCPRFDVNRASGPMKEAFLRLRKRASGLP